MNISRTIFLGPLFIFVLGCVLLAGAQKSDKPPASVSQIEASVKRDPNNPKLLVALGLAYRDGNDSPCARSLSML